MPVRITLLGRMAVHGNGTEITRATKGNSGQLLAYLALHPHGVTTEEAMETLWPERGPGQAPRPLYGAADRTRALLQEHLGTVPATGTVPYILAGSGTWRLDPARITTDLDAFTTAFNTTRATGPRHRRAVCERALALYTGDLCTGMDHPWLEGFRTDLRDRALALLDDLITTAPDPQIAIAHLEQALALDPYNEPLHLRLAELHARRGSTDAVARLKERLTRTLADIDEKPSPDTTRSFTQLLQHRPAPMSARTTASPRR